MGSGEKGALANLSPACRAVAKEARTRRVNCRRSMSMRSASRWATPGAKAMAWPVFSDKSAMVWSMIRKRCSGCGAGTSGVADAYSWYMRFFVAGHSVYSDGKRRSGAEPAVHRGACVGGVVSGA